MPGALPFSDVGGLAPPGTIGLPDDYQRINADPNAFGAGLGQADQKVGAALDQAGSAAFQVQAVYDRTAAANAFAQLRDRVTATSWGNPADPNAPPGLLATAGDQAMNGYQPAVDSLKKAQTDIASTLSPAAQRQFNLQAQRLVGDTTATYDQHRAMAQRQWQVNSYDAQAASAQSAAIANSDNQTAFAHGLADQRNAIISKGNELGWSPDVIGQELAAKTSQTYTGVTQRLADVNPQTAWAYYQANQDQFTGADRLAVEGRLRPALLAWGSRDKAEGIIQQFGGNGSPATPAGPLSSMIQTSATSQGYDPHDALTVAKLENNGGQAADRPGSQYQGPFQMGDAAWAARGGTAANRSDPSAQVDLGVGNLVHSREVAQQTLGQTPQGWQTYLVHQQGDAGGPALLKADASQNAIAALAPAYGGDTAKARQAIVGNGGTPVMTAGQFRSMWQARYQAAASSTAGLAGPSTNVKPYVVGDSIAQGVQQANATDGGGTANASPDAVLDSVNAIPVDAVRGRNVVLSTGLTNDPSKLDVVQQQLDSLKARGANVTLLGVGSRPDLAPLNAQLAALAQKNGATFTPIQAGPDGVNPASFKGLGVPAQDPQQPTAPVSGPAAFRANVPAMMDAASKVLDPFGQSNPQFVDQVQSRIRAKLNEQEYAQREADRASRETLLGAAMGSPSTAAAAAPGTASAAAGGITIPGTNAPAISGPSPVPQRPTSLDQLLQSPAAKQAWLSASPETQRSTLQLLEHNARGEDPPMTPAAQGLYYQLSGMAVNDREAFQKLDLSDPQYTSALPHSYWNTLAGEQRRFGNADVARAARDETQARALTVLKPDLLSAGFKVDGLKPGTAAATTYDQFVGRLRQSLDDFQTANNRRPNDGEVAKIGQTLLMQGTQRGTAGIFPWSSDTAVRGFQVDPSQFVPTIPPAARQGIVQAYTAKFGQPPTEGQVAEAFMRSQAASTAKQAPRGTPRPGTPGIIPPAETASGPAAQPPIRRNASGAPSAADQASQDADAIGSLGGAAF